MANTVLTPDIIAKEAVVILDNELVMGKKVFRGYEKEFDNKVNGYSVGDSVTVRKPTDFTVRDGAVRSVQDVVEGKTTITVDKQKGVDFEFTSKDLTLNIKDLSDRVIRPALIQLANQIDTDIMAEYKNIPSWVGTPGQLINSFSDFYTGVTRLNELAVPQEMRCGTLSPSDHGALLGSQTALYNDTINKPAYREGNTGKVGGVDLYMTQNVPTHTVGVATGTPLVNGADQNVTYDAVKDTGTQTLNTDGWTNSTTGILKAGDVFTIAGVNAVNPVTKADLGFLRQFTVVADANSGASTGPAALTISPPIITSGAFKTCSAAPADNAAITVVGTGGTNYRQNMLFHRNAFSLVSVPMISPPGAKDVARRTYKGMSVRVIPDYDHTNDKSIWRLDVLYGVDTVDPRLATRLSGTS